ncbi:hypothetical protein MKW94_029402 [Papaver nudicaule]|uniref:Uncharacterized protein n=1 Tax=Papaver nudicaule TaxID=74823 RepID=A0AA41VB84_PAPNU|nr:hypothetical protein [Papaver nudicaule]
MATIIHFILIALFIFPTHTLSQSNDDGFVSLLLSEKGVNFAKDVLIEQAISSLAPLQLPQVFKKSVRIPIIGNINMGASNVTIYQVNVSSSSITLNNNNTGEISIVASGATANLSMNWSYSYHSWGFFPFEITDQGVASIQVEGMDVKLNIGLEYDGGTLKLSPLKCGCLVKDIAIILDGGLSWLYQGFINAFGGQIRSAVESTISDKIREGILKLDSLLQTLPKEVPVDDIASLNVTLVNKPLFEGSSIGLEINGLFTAKESGVVSKYYHKNLESSVNSPSLQKMLGISLDQAVFNSASDVYFKADSLRWIVEKVPDQSYLNTNRWRYIVPQLYKKYPNDNMRLNISFSTPPFLKIHSDEIDVTIYSDMIIEVLNDDEIIPVACISVIVKASGYAKITENNLGGHIDMEDFDLSLKWSKIGNFHMHLIESLMRTFIKTAALPYANSRLTKGFPLPIFRGFTLQNADLIYRRSKIMISTDVGFTGS